MCRYSLVFSNSVLKYQWNQFFPLGCHCLCSQGCAVSSLDNWEQLQVLASSLFSLSIGTDYLTELQIQVLQEGGPHPWPESGFLSNTWRWIVWGDTWADKARDFIGKGALVESSRVGGPRRTAQLLARSLGFYDDGISFQIVFGQSFWLRVLLGSACIAQLRWMPVRGILGGARTCDVSLWPFLNSSG